MKNNSNFPQEDRLSIGDAAPPSADSAMRPMEQSFSNVVRQYAIPFSELYLLRCKEDFVYFSDPETYDLLHISAPDPEELLPNCTDYTQKKCYEALQNRTDPCPFCTNHLLQFDQYYTWQHYNDISKRNYLLKDKLTYFNGRVARMEVVMDITDPDRKDQLLMQSIKGNNLVLGCITALSSGASLDESLQRIMGDICDYFQADSGLCILLEDPRICVQWSASGQYRCDPMAQTPSLAAIAEWSGLFCGKRQLVLPDIMADSVGEDLRALWTSHNIHSLVMTPLMTKGRLIGYLTLHNISCNREQISVLDLICASITKTMVNSMLLEQNRRLQYVDPLTGFLNFDGFRQHAKVILKECAHSHYAIWYCDIKRFKYINDDFGYAAGDRLLRHWAQVIHDHIRDGETFGRISGDNLVILTYYRSQKELEKRYDRMVRLVQDYLNQPGRRFTVEIVAGIYLMRPQDPADPDLNQMLDWANVAQKSVKFLSGGRLSFFNDDLWKKQLRTLEISQHMSVGLKNGEFSVWFQPQYNYESGNLIGAEALVRWTHPTLGSLSPAEFIPILELEGQITELDRFVWEQACRCMRRWLDRQGKLIPVPLSVNVSRMDIRNTQLMETLLSLVRRYDIPPKMLRLEITESAYMEEPEQLIDVAERLREQGFTVEMDDFGSGYSSLNMLKDVPVDILKLDMRFLSSPSNTFRGGNILSSVIRMAHWLELSVIAEGVETQIQADYLKSLGCYLMQGYYFSRPLPEQEFEALLKPAVLEDIDHKYRGVGLPNMEEFLDPNSRSSFLFNSCIGGGGVLEFNGTTVEALMLNDAFYQAIGWPREAFDPYRHRMLDTVYPEDLPALRDTLSQAIALGAASCQVRILRSGRLVRMQYRHLSSSASNHTLFILVEDVTRQHELQLELKEVTTELSSYLDLMPGGVFRYEAGGEGRFGYISRGLPEMLGYTGQQFRSKFRDCFSEMVYIGDRPRILKEIACQIAKGDSSFCEYRVETADGSLKWLYDAGRLVTDSHGKRWFYVIVTDIDAQKRANA